MIRFDRVTFHYPEAPGPAIRDVTLRLPEGGLSLVIGASGAGKSTLLRCINGLVPHFSGGTFAGRVTVGSLDPVKEGPAVMSRHVGFVFQDPEAQFVMDRVEDEIAFALENAAVPRPEMQARVEEVLARLDLGDLRWRSLATLSGGEKQRVAIAAALALQPEILVLDEPTSQLDPQSAEDVLEALARLNRDLGITVILAEHRLERVLPFTDFVVALPDRPGPPIAGLPAEVLTEVALVPPVTALGKALGWEPLPVTLAEARALVRERTPLWAAEGISARVRQPDAGQEPATEARARSANDGLISSLIGAEDRAPSGENAILSADALEVAYDGTPVLRDVSLKLYPGEVVVLMGRNGAGKSTLLKALVGLVRPRRGTVSLLNHDTTDMTVADICRRVAYLPQDPNALLFAETVLEELHITLRNHAMRPNDAPLAPQALLASLDLDDKAEAYPRELSVGERQRVALAAVMVTGPYAVLLDEPTRGLDYRAKTRLSGLIRGLRTEGRAVLLVTHDVELAAATADRVMVMESGTLTAQGSPEEILSRSSTFAPQMAQLFPGLGWLTVSDVLAGLPERRAAHLRS